VLTVGAMKDEENLTQWQRDALSLIERQQKTIVELSSENVALQKMVQEAIMRANQALDLASK
jgi:hypothetical protein